MAGSGSELGLEEEARWLRAAADDRAAQQPAQRAGDADGARRPWWLGRDAKRPLADDDQPPHHPYPRPHAALARRPLRLRLLAQLAVAATLLTLLFTVYAGDLVSFVTSGDENAPSPLVVAKNAAVATEVAVCSEIGKLLLQEGGSAIDGIIGSSLCVGLVNAFSSGIGGGGFLIYRSPDGQTEVIDFREMAPSAATPDMFGTDPQASQLGGLAVGVPGELRGYELAHKRHGKLPWKQVLQPVIDLARKGFVISEELAARLKRYEAIILNSAGFNETYAFPKTGATRVLVAGELCVRDNWARTLELVAEKGADAFYTGEVAQSLVNTIRGGGGIITMSDMANYVAKVREPLTSFYHGRKILTAGPPASGAALLSVFNILEGFTLEAQGPVPLSFHRITEAFKHAFAQRTYFGDPDFVNIDAKIASIISKDTASLIRRNISDLRTFDWEYYNPDFEIKDTPGTTHLSVVDAAGGAAAMTSTINLEFGAKLMDPRYGVIMNNQMDDFSRPNITNAFGLRPSKNNFIAPGKRPLSSSTPSIIEKDGQFEIVIGASGGSRIITGTSLALLNLLDFKMAVNEAIDYPRFHHQLLPNQIAAEFLLDEDVFSFLQSRGHVIQKLDLGAYQSVVQSVKRTPEGLLNAASDRRKGGLAVGF